MLMKIGITAWVWIAPVTTSSFVELVPKIAQMGFDWIEVPIDGMDDLDYQYAGKVVAETDPQAQMVATYRRKLSMALN